MFDAGLTLFEVRQRLGHKSPTLTAEIYTHLNQSRTAPRSALRRLLLGHQGRNGSGEAARNGRVTGRGTVA